MTQDVFRFSILRNITSLTAQNSQVRTALFIVRIGVDRVIGLLLLRVLVVVWNPTDLQAILLSQAAVRVPRGKPLLQRRQLWSISGSGTSSIPSLRILTNLHTSDVGPL